MNQLGHKYVAEQSKRLSEYNKVREAGKPKWESVGWPDSAVQERIMRLGREAVKYELDVKNSSELEQMAIATLQEDFLKRYEEM